MKKIWIIIALASLGATTADAQNKDCKCKRKADRTAVLVPNKAVKQTMATEQSAACLIERKDYLGATHCDDIKYESTSIYMGNYPAAAKKGESEKMTQVVKTTKSKKAAPVRKTKMMAATTIDNTQRATVHDDEESAEVAAYYHYTPADRTPAKPCQLYVQNDIIVKDCPSDFYDNSKVPLRAAPMMEYKTENIYMGYYPEQKDSKAMENRQVDGPYTAGDELSPYGRHR